MDFQLLNSRSENIEHYIMLKIYNNQGYVEKSEFFFNFFRPSVLKHEKKLLLLVITERIGKQNRTKKKKVVVRTMLKSIKTKHIFDAFLVGTLLRKMKSPTITVAFCRHTTDSLRADPLLQRCINAPTVLYKVPPIFQIVYTGQQNYACTVHILKKNLK